MKIKILSLGCRLNQSEIESISTTLTGMGHEIVGDRDADVYIINSCAVTARSERKTRHLIYQALSSSGRSNPRVIVTGCAPEDIKTIPSITYVSNDDKSIIPDIIEPGARIPMQTLSRFSYDIPLKPSRNRVNLKIQDGCDCFCSYCIIPLMRGAPLSKPFHSVMNEFRTLLERGCREIILTGVNIGRYCDSGHTLESLVETILDIEGDFRLHLTSLEPQSATGRLVSLFNDRKLVRHLHLSLQSGSDSVLKRMNRPYNGRDYLSAVAGLKRVDPLFNFTTDVIVGFPGETGDEFSETLALIAEAGFSHIHTFRYSPRPGTAAAAMDNPVPEIIKTERSRIVIDLYSEQKKKFYENFSGKESIFLSEKFRYGSTRGFNEYYVPVEVDINIPANRFYRIKTEPDKNRPVLKGYILDPISE